MPYFRGLSLIELGRLKEAKSLFQDFMDFAENELATKAEIDYFATSLPLLLVLDEDLDDLKQRNAKFLLKLAEQGLEQLAEQQE